MSDFAFVFDSLTIEAVVSFVLVLDDFACLGAGSGLSARLPLRRNSRRAVISLTAVISISVLVPFLSSQVAM